MCMLIHSWYISALGLYVCQNTHHLFPYLQCNPCLLAFAFIQCRKPSHGFRIQQSTLLLNAVINVLPERCLIFLGMAEIASGYLWPSASHLTLCALLVLLAMQDGILCVLQSVPPLYKNSKGSVWYSWSLGKLWHHYSPARVILTQDHQGLVWHDSCSCLIREAITL